MSRRVSSVEKRKLIYQKKAACSSGGGTSSPNVTETDDTVTQSLDFLSIGGYADDSANYPNYTNGDAAKIRIDEINGGLKVNQANLDQTEDNVRAFQGATVNQDNITTSFRSDTVDSVAVSVQPSPSNLYKINVINKSAELCVIKFYDNLLVNPVTDTPIYTITVADTVGEQKTQIFDIPIPFQTGLMVRAVTGLEDNDTTNLTNEPILEIFYK